MKYMLKEIGNEIFIVENLLNEQLCDQIIQVADHYPYQQAGFVGQPDDLTIRNNEMLHLNDQDPLLNSTNELLNSCIVVIQELLYNHYGLSFPYSEFCTILRYRKGQFYQRHIDNIVLSGRFEEAENCVPMRDISIVGYLNQDFLGGETFFDRQNLKVNPKKGFILIFPSSWTHPHQSLPVTEGVKYAFVSWLYHGIKNLH